MEPVHARTPPRHARAAGTSPPRASGAGTARASGAGTARASGAGTARASGATAPPERAPSPSPGPTARAASGPPLLEAEAVSLRFGGVQALTRVSFSVRDGEVVALIGPNGAGKSSLFNCIGGLYRPQEGDVRVRGRSLRDLSPHRVAALGVARSFQNVELFSRMSTLDNVLLGRHRHVRSGLLGALLGTPSWRRDEVAQRRRAEEVLDLLDLQAYRDLPVGMLPYGVQKLVEVGRALASEPALLLLDEPAAGLTADEKDEMMARLLHLREEMDLALLIVEHDLRVVSRLAERVLVLDHGILIADGPPAEVQSDPQVVRAYLGEERIA